MADFYILSKNYLNKYDTINASSGLVGISRLYDQRFDLVWGSSGETTETGYNTFIEIIFYENSNTINRTYDTIILQNINLKQFKLQNYSGGFYSDIPNTEQLTNNNSTIRIKLASPVTGSRIKLLMQSTIIANQEKQIGEFWVALETMNLAQYRTTRTRADYLRGGDYYLADGTLHTYHIFAKTGHSWQVTNLSDTDYKTLKNIYDQHGPFVIYPNFDKDIDEIYLVQWTGPFGGSTNPKISINTIKMELKEQ